MSPPPAVSICIPTFDRLSYLQEAVASARAQTARDVEILIGDDGDSLELRSWCLAQAAADSRVRYHKTPGRLRLAGNWNFLATLARGEYVTLMGDDDRLLPEFAERLLTAARPDVAVIFSNHHVIDEAGRRSVGDSLALTRRYGRAYLAEGTVQDVATLVWRNSVPMASCIVRAQDVRRLSFKSDINTPELELFVRLAAEKAGFVFVDEYLMEYRVHGGSATAGGLTMDRLAEYLDPVPVPPEVESLKRNCLSAMLVAGVGIRLGRGDVRGARALLASRYYPRGFGNLRAATQRALLTLPEPLVSPVFGWLRGIVKRRRQ